MPQNHTVQKGDCMTSIAAQYGFNKFETIYNHAANEQFKRDHPNPDVLTPGRVVVIPDRDVTPFTGKSTDQTHKFKLKRPKCMLKLELKDDQDQPLASKEYVLVVGNTTLEGTTDGSGKIEKEIPPNQNTGVVTVYMDRSDAAAPVINFAVELGGLEPHTTITGAQQRLQNLGFDCGGTTGVADARTQEAVRAFQGKNGLTVNGNLDDATKTKLKDLHKS